LIGGDLILVYNTDISIAFREKTGNYNKINASIFRLKDIMKKAPVTEMKVQLGKQISFKAKCSVCGEVHTYVYSAHDVMKREMTIGGCETTGKPIMFIGRENKINNIVDRYNEINKKIYAMF
jgi:hypothetical protein